MKWKFHGTRTMVAAAKAVMAMGGAMRAKHDAIAISDAWRLRAMLVANQVMAALPYFVLLL